MHSLIFEHFCGKELCATADDVRAVFRRDVNGVNEWIISDSTDSRSPYLSVLANQDAAAVFYIPADGSDSAGFQAYGGGCMVQLLGRFAGLRGMGRIVAFSVPNCCK